MQGSEAGAPSIRHTTDPGNCWGLSTDATDFRVAIADPPPGAQRVLTEEPVSMTTVTPEVPEHAAALAGAAAATSPAPARPAAARAADSRVGRRAIRRVLPGGATRARPRRRARAGPGRRGPGAGARRRSAPALPRRTAATVADGADAHGTRTAPPGRSSARWWRRRGRRLARRQRPVATGPVTSGAATSSRVHPPARARPGASPAGPSPRASPSTASAAEKAIATPQRRSRRAAVLQRREERDGRVGLGGHGRRR